ncbi:MAG: outer membrane protein assembly factor BamD [Mucilaginibacter sp.]
MFKKQLSLFSGILVVLLLALGSCKSKYEKLRASNDNGKKFQEAKSLYNKKEYTKALGLFDDIAPKYRGQASAAELFYYQAMANYKLKDYTSAAYLFKQFAETFPSDPKAEECRFLTAYCFYLDSPTFSLDQDNTLKAIERLQLFINLYPNSEKVAEANKLIQTLHERLEEKSYANSKLYLTIGYYQAAVIAFGNTLRDYPDTKYGEEIDYLTAKAEYEYAAQSLETKQEERYSQAITMVNQFNDKYPTSKFAHEVADIKKDSEQGIIKAKQTLAQAQADFKFAQKLAKKDTTQVTPSSEKGNNNQKIPN